MVWQEREELVPGALREGVLQTVSCRGWKVVTKSIRFAAVRDGFAAGEEEEEEEETGDDDAPMKGKSARQCAVRGTGVGTGGVTKSVVARRLLMHDRNLLAHDRRLLAATDAPQRVPCRGSGNGSGGTRAG